MKLFGIRVPFTSERAAPSVADDRWFSPPGLGWAGGDETRVTPQTAIRFTPVFAAVRVIAGNLAALPLVTYERRKDGGKERAARHPLYKLLKTRPNLLKTTAFEFREMLTGHMLLYGNAYAQILRNKLGEPVELYPLHPTCVTPKLDGRELVYEVRADKGQTVRLPGYEVVHLRAYRDSGLEGLSPIAAARKAIEAGLCLEDFSRNFFQGGAFPAGVLEYDAGAMSKDAKDNLRESWQKLYGGQNRGKQVAVLEAGLKWKPMGIPQSDAQFLEQRRFGVEEVSRIFGVPPHLLGDLSRSTNNNIEQQSLEFVTHCLLPWMTRWEQVVVRDLLDGDDDRFFVKHVVNALLRGDSAARGQFYSQGRQWGWFSINDVRELEDMNPIGPDGDVYLSPLNMVPAGTEGQQLQQDEPAGTEPDGTADERVKAAFRGAFRETWRRVVRKEVNAIRTAARKKGEEFDPWFDEFVADHQTFADDCLRQLVVSYCTLRGMDPPRVLADVGGGYRASVRDRVDAWRAEPARGYDHREDELATYWTERLLSYTREGYEQAA